MDFLGSDPTTTTFPTQTGQQSDLINNLLKMASGKLTSGQFDFGPIEQQARTNFTQSTIPSITEMFNDPGGEGLRSSGFQGAVGRAGSDLESNLAAMKANYNLQEQGLMQNLVGAGMQPQFDTHHEPGSSPLGGMGGILGALGMA